MIRGKRALILGATGQDGAHVAAHLVRDGWQVYGGFRRGSASKVWRLDYLEILDKINLVNINIDEPYNLVDVFKEVQPEQIYHFAGESFVADSFTHPVTTFQANSIGTLNVLEAMRHSVPKAKLFFASSSEVFKGVETGVLLNEESMIAPANPYGISKMAAQHMVRMYREVYGIFTSAGMLFNHEGPLRARNFVTRKITFNLARLKLHGGGPVELGLFDSARDWGSAEDYTNAMTRLLMEDEDPDDFVFATGKLSTVREFLASAASEVGFDPVFEGEDQNEVCVDKLTGKKLAVVSGKFYRPHETSARVGDSTKLRRRIGWEGSRSAETLAAEMVRADIERWNTGVINV